MSETEIWKRVYIDGAETNYEVSNTGKLRHYITKRPRKLFKSHKGYRTTHLTVKGKERTIQIHVLVARAFIPKTDEDIDMGRNQVNHKDGNKENNHVSNLEWMTCHENMKHAFDTGLRTIEKGEKCIAAKFTEKQIRRVCNYLSTTNLPAIEIAQLTGVTVHVVRDVLRRRTWTHISKDYDFETKNGRRVVEERRVNWKNAQFVPIVDEGIIRGYTGPQILDILNKEFHFDYTMIPKMKALIKARRKKLKQIYPDGFSSYLWITFGD